MSADTTLFLEIMSVRDTNGPCSGKMKTSSSILEELTPEEKKIQKEVQSLKINLDITRSNAEEINKILDNLELA